MTFSASLARIDGKPTLYRRKYIHTYTGLYCKAVVEQKNKKV